MRVAGSTRCTVPGIDGASDDEFVDHGGGEQFGY